MAVAVVVVAAALAAAGSDITRAGLGWLLILAGCRAESPPPAPGEGFSPTSAPSRAIDIGTSGQIAPGDTATILLFMRATISQIDSAVGGMTSRDTTFLFPGEAAARHMTLWLQGNEPRKLVVAEPNEAGAMMEESSYWFVDHELRVALRPFDGYFLEGDRILIWTDGTMVPHTDVSSSDRMAQETTVLGEVAKRLAVFGDTL